MQNRFNILLSVVLVFIIAIACAPNPSSPSPSMPGPAATPPNVFAPTPTSQEGNWAKVMAEAKKEGKLVVYSYYMIGETGIGMKQGFKKATGLDLELITSTGAVMIERIKAERRGGFQVASVMDGSPALFVQAKMEGLTQAAGLLPELQDKQVWRQYPIMDKEGHILASSFILFSPWVNTKIVKPGEEPKSWRDMLQTKWKGTISGTDPDVAPLVIYAYFNLVKKYGILDDAYFRELGKSMALRITTRMDAESVARGEAAISFINSPSAIGPFLQAGAPVKAIDMEEGVIGRLSTSITALSKAPHPNAALVFINWWFSQDGQNIFHKTYGTESLRKDVPDFTPLPGQLTPKRVLFGTSAEDDEEMARMQRERVVKKLLLGN